MVSSARAMPVSRPSTFRLVRESSAPVGSSANSTAGLLTSARAIAMRCAWPPDSSPARRPARSVSSSRASQAPACR